MMEHKEMKMIAAALLAGGLVYFGMQYYQNKNDDNVKIQDTTSGDTGTKEEKMKALWKGKQRAGKGEGGQKGAGSGDQSEKIKQMQDRLEKIEEKMKSLPADKQEKFKQVEEKIKAAIAKMQAKATPTTATPTA